MVDIAFGACFYVSGEAVQDAGLERGEFCYEAIIAHRWYNVGTFILCFPNAMRFAQNMRHFYTSKKRHPHLTNACKYMLKLMVTLFGIIHRQEVTPSNYPAFFWCWIAIMVFSALYSFLWDIIMDWGILIAEDSCLCFPCSRFYCGRHQGLVFQSSWPYYLAIGLNLVGRFFFIFTLLPYNSLEFVEHARIYNIVSFVAPSIEVCRRAMWCIFMFEYKVLQMELPTMPRVAGNKDWITVRGSTRIEIFIVVFVLTACLAAMWFTRDL